MYDSALATPMTQGINSIGIIFSPILRSQSIFRDANLYENGPSARSLTVRVIVPNDRIVPSEFIHQRERAEQKQICASLTWVVLGQIGNQGNLGFYCGQIGIFCLSMANEYVDYSRHRIL